MKKYTDIFPMRLKALRNAYGISLSETAYLLRVNAKSTVFEWENQKKVPSVENLHMISTVFGTPTDWLLGHSEILYSEESIKWTENFISWIENSMQNRFDELTGTEPGEVSHFGLTIYNGTIPNMFLKNNVFSIIHCRYGRILLF